MERCGSKTALVAVGTLIPKALEIADEYEKQTGQNITVINPRFLTGIDEPLLSSLHKDHDLVITLEDGELDGGYGQRIAAFYGDSDMKVKCFGISKAFHSDFNADKLLAQCGISAENIIAYILSAESRSHRE